MNWTGSRSAMTRLDGSATTVLIFISRLIPLFVIPPTMHRKRRSSLQNLGLPVKKAFFTEKPQNQALQLEHFFTGLSVN
ncbi:MAG: hypothetical protein ACJAZT_001824 [Gammaproteobacteria bacterium]|jgi:hypothetical protein